MKRHLQFLFDMLLCIDRIDKYVKNIDFDSFYENEMLLDAVLRNLEIIGEAARHIPEEIRKNFAEVPWREIIGLRNIIAHNYSSIDIHTIWETVQVDLPNLRGHIVRAFSQEKAVE
jgi:uncharacterized protein with HEPN domain